MPWGRGRETHTLDPPLKNRKRATPEGDKCEITWGSADLFSGLHGFSLSPTWGFLALTKGPPSTPASFMHRHSTTLEPTSNIAYEGSYYGG